MKNRRNTLISGVIILFCMLVAGLASAAASDSKNHEPLQHVFIQNCTGQGNYGLYTYFTFKDTPLSTTFDHAIEQIIYILNKVTRLNEKNFYVPHTERSVLYIPVIMPPQRWVKYPNPDSIHAAARWILRYYDFNCANQILDRIGKPAATGPFIVSSLYKLSPNLNHSSVTVTQDFTYIDMPTSKFLLDTFFRKTWYRRTWDESRIANLGHSMQATLDTFFSATNTENDTIEIPQNDIVFVPYIHDEPTDKVPAVSEDTGIKFIAESHPELMPDSKSPTTPEAITQNVTAADTQGNKTAIQTFTEASPTININTDKTVINTPAYKYVSIHYPD